MGSSEACSSNVPFKLDFYGREQGMITGKYEYQLRYDQHIFPDSRFVKLQLRNVFYDYITYSKEDSFVVSPLVFY